MHRKEDESSESDNTLFYLEQGDKVRRQKGNPVYFYASSAGLANLGLSQENA